LFVFAPVYGVASTGTYPKYAPADVPCRRTQIRRHPVELFFSAGLRKSKKNAFEIHYFPFANLDPFIFEHFYFLLYSGSRCLSLKSTNPTGCGDNTVSGNLRRIGVCPHGLPNPPICFASQGMGDLFIGRYAPFGNLSQKIVCLFGKGLHFFRPYFAT
jgi:hypothetical protein